MCFFLLSNLTIAKAMAAVTVLVDKEEFSFEHQPRLVEVLASIANEQNWYWPSAVLFDVDNGQLEATRQLLLESLSNIIKTHKKDEPKLAQSIEHLRATIASWRLAKRLPLKIDYDLARIMSAANPRLPDGKYILEVSERKNTVQLFGAVDKTDQLAHLGYADISKYINGVMTSDLADKDYVFIIQADGRKIQAPVAYWNKKHNEVMPGSQLFVPFEESLFQPQYRLINQQIMLLALNRLQ